MVEKRRWAHRVDTWYCFRAVVTPRHTDQHFFSSPALTQVRQELIMLLERLLSRVNNVRRCQQSFVKQYSPVFKDHSTWDTLDLKQYQSLGVCLPKISSLWLLNMIIILGRQPDFSTYKITMLCGTCLQI